MSTETMVILIVVLFAIIVVVGFAVYGRRAKVRIEVPGGKLDFEGSNDDASAMSSQPRRTPSGILGNLSIGKTQMRAEGGETIANNISVGDTDMSATSRNSMEKPSRKRK